MTSLLFWTCAISVVTAISCAICGVYLVAKQEALISEGLGHAVLPGITVGFIIFRERNSPWLLIFAALTGIVMVLIFQFLRRTRLVDVDASLGIVFSAMFSGGVILSTQNLRNIHFHPECIIDGNIAEAALDTLIIGDVNFGPRTLWTMLTVLSILILFIVICYKEMNVMTFDESFAQAIRLRPNLLHFIWLGLVSLTTVCAFETAGSILVVALMIAPPAAGYLLSNSMLQFFLWSGAIAAISAVAGVFLGYELDISPVGPIAFCSGLAFLTAAMLAPKQGLISRLTNRSNHRYLLFKKLFLRTLEDGTLNKLSNSNLLWSRREHDLVIRNCLRENLVTESNGDYRITDLGLKELEINYFSFTTK